jgi:hypothetical protein
MPVPGLRMGNSSSMELGIGIGPDILPRMDWPGFGRPAAGLDLNR